jgi:hypothetical protein
VSARAWVSFSVAIAVGCARRAGTNPSSSAGAATSPPQPSAVSAASASASSGSRKRKCSSNALSSLQIDLKDALTGAPICDASVVAVLGTEQTPLSSFPSPGYCIYSGVYETLGTFQVTVTEPRYEPLTTTIVVDQNDGCHVVPQHRVVKLQPKPRKVGGRSSK